MSSVAKGDANLTSGSHILFGSLEFIIIGEGDNLNLVPRTDKPANFPKPVVNLQRHFDELKNTWPNKFSLPDLPQAA
jgi:hypothetical protein